MAMLMVSITGCDNMLSDDSRTTWNRGAAERLGIPAGPITAEQAKQIAEQTTSGTAVSAERSTERGTEVFTVRVQSGSSEFGITEQIVNVRVSDGAVMEVKSGGGCRSHDDSDD